MIHPIYIPAHCKPPPTLPDCGSSTYFILPYFILLYLTLPVDQFSYFSFLAYWFIGVPGDGMVWYDGMGMMGMMGMVGMMGR
ncbi:hypothetical protein BZA77DRAFT_310758 [Pyronema omphalodes]|nr:hypothetical protein BZA77DRAFT_310758 [Pyronema omphalodes]